MRTLSSRSNINSDSKLHVLLDHLFEGVVVTDRFGMILEYNLSALRIFNLESEPIGNRNILDPRWLTFNEDLTPIADADRPSMVALRTGQIQSDKLMGIRTAAGELRWISVTAVPIFDENSALPDQVLITFKDITEQRKAEQDLKAMSERLSIVIEAVAFGIWDWDLRKNVLYWDDFMYVVFNQDKSNLPITFDVFEKMLVPKDAKRVNEELRQIWQEKKEYFHSTFQIVDKDNNKKWIKACARCFYDESGSIARMTGANWDITETTNKDRELLESQKLLRKIVDATPDWIYLKDLKHRYLMVNQSYASALKKKPDDLIGKNDLELGFPEEIVKGSTDGALRGFWNDDQLVIKSKTTQVFSDDPASVDGEIRHFHTIKAPLLDEANNVYAVLGYSRDLTQDREKDTQLEEQRVKLLASSKMSALGEMAGGIAHEINNPLAIIVGQSSRLRTKIERGLISLPDVHKDLEKIERTAHRIATIIRGLRSFSRNSDGDPMEPVHLEDIIEDTLELCRERFRNLSIDMRVVLPRCQAVECRAAQISQVIMNLLVNALDAVESLTKKWVEVSIFETGNRIHIHVTDSGNGIPGEILEKIMQPFFTTKEVGRGTGLGLSISKGIIEDHQGVLYYDTSSANTRFVIELPFLQNARK